MSYFELSLLAGLALGGLLAGQLWAWLGKNAFGAVALVYIFSAGLLYAGAIGSNTHGRAQAVEGFFRALRHPSLQHLAPVWLCVNTIVGLWLGPTLIFLLTHNSQNHQFLDGVFADKPERVGWGLLAYSIVFGVSVTAWSFVLPHVPLQRALRVTLVAMLLVCGEFFLFNHIGSGASRWFIGAPTAPTLMGGNGLPPAALSTPAGGLGAPGRRERPQGRLSPLASLWS